LLLLLLLLLLLPQRTSHSDRRICRIFLLLRA